MSLLEKKPASVLNHLSSIEDAIFDLVQLDRATGIDTREAIENLKSVISKGIEHLNNEQKSKRKILGNNSV